jgi:hypothetical protein
MRRKPPKKRWIQRALGVRPRRRKRGIRVEAARKGALHRMLGIPERHKIPLSTLKWAARQPGKMGQRARFALNVRGLGKR